MGNHQPGRRASRTTMASHLDERDLEFLVKETNMSSVEVLEYYDRFCGATQGSQTINSQTFREIMQKCYPRTYKAELESDIFSLYDVDNNGEIEFREFLVIISIMSEGTAKVKLQQIFRIFDSDKNGFISLEELTTIVKHLYHLIPQAHKETDSTPEKLTEKLMTEMDSDKDGVVSEDEFVLAFLRNETLTSNLINKIMTRFTSAKARILED